MNIKFNINWPHILKETPQISYKEINSNYVDKHLITPIKKAIEEENFISTNDPEIFQIPKIFGGIFFAYKNNVIIGVVSFDIYNHNKKTLLTPTLIKKFDEDYPNLLYRIYKVASKELNASIASGYVQTLSSSSIWKKFWNNPDKYDIKEIYTIPHGLTKEDDIWGDDKRFREVRIVIKF